MIGLLSLGVLTSLDLRRGLVKVVLGFVVALLASVYAIAHSVIGEGLAPLMYGDWSLFLVSLPTSLGVVAGGFLLSRTTRHKMIKANFLASLTLVIGLGLGSAFKASVNMSLDSVIVTSLYFMALGLPANITQMFLLHFLDKLWKARNISLAMMPTAFFAYNLLTVLGYLASSNLGHLYVFFSSLGFLPALALAGVGSSMIAKNGSGTVGSGMSAKKSSGPVNTPGPTITVTGSPVVRQGEDQNIKIATGSGGQPQNMASIKATIRKPGGKVEFLRLSRIAAGVYKAFYRPRGEPGDHIVKVSATSKEHLTKDKSFSFTVQPPPAPHAPPQTTPKPASSKPAPLKIGPQIRTPPAPPPPPPRPTTPQSTHGLPMLDNWDPKVWVNQEVHGYRVKEHLATGLTGYILRASFEHGGAEMAIKIPILRTGIGTTALDETMSEASKLLDLSGQSKYIVQLRGILVDRLTVQEIIKGDTALYLKSPPAIIMEFMKGGTAKRLLEDSSYDSLYYSEKWGGIVMLIGHMIASGLETIHKDGFVHLDVKPQNILFNVQPPTTGQEMMDQMLSGELVPKLADLGSAVKTGGKIGQFTSEYAPGEQVLGSGAAPSMDIYALGATVYNMLTKTPVNSKKLIDTMNRAIGDSKSGGAAKDLNSAWNSFNPDFTKMDSKLSSIIPTLKQMLARDPMHRPSAGEVASSLRNLTGRRGH